MDGIGERTCKWSKSRVLGGWIVHPHQRCGYSDSPFARKDTFLYCRGQKWVGGGGGPWVVLVNGLKTHLKKTHFSLFFAGPRPRPGLAKKDGNLKKDAAGPEKIFKK